MLVRSLQCQLSNHSPADPPAFPLGFLNNGFDVYAMRQALIQARTFLETSPSLSTFITGRYGQPGNSNSDIDSFHQATVASIWHPCCTAQLAATGSTAGVLNPQFQVRGVNHLRVVDASVFVSSVAGPMHTPRFLRQLTRSLFLFSPRSPAATPLE